MVFAAAYFVSPAWVAVTTHGPALNTFRVVPTTEQPVEVGVTAKLTVRPLLAVAESAYAPSEILRTVTGVNEIV